MKFNLYGKLVAELEPVHAEQDNLYVHHTHCPECERELGPQDVINLDDDLIYLCCLSCGHEWKEPND